MRANAASRLLDVLADLSKQSGDKCRQVWAGTLGVEPKDTGDLLAGIASVLHLMTEARQLVVAVVGDQNAGLHMTAFEQLEKTFASLNLGANSKRLKEGVAEAVRGLRFTVDLVERVDGGGDIDAELLESLIDEANTQIEALANSGLPDDVKTVLHQRISKVREVAEELRLSGLGSLEAALDGVVGAAVRYSDTKEPKQKKWLDGLSKMVDLGLKLISLAKGVPQLAEVGRKLIGSGD